MFKNILIVCAGNICRSPTAEFLLREQMQAKRSDTNIHSAGLQAVVGSEAEENTRQVAEKYGLSLSGHIARQITLEDIRSSDLILTMEESHIKAIEGMAQDAKGKVHLFGRWNQGIEIFDPYRQGRKAHEDTYHLINEAVQQWVKCLHS